MAVAGFSGYHLPGLLSVRYRCSEFSPQEFHPENGEIVKCREKPIAYRLAKTLADFLA
jgi:hypothetical protein